MPAAIQENSVCLIILSTLLLTSEMDISSLLTKHNTAIQSIRTLRCDMEVEEQSQHFSLKGTGTYIRSGSTVRVVENNLIPGRRVETLFVNGITRTIQSYNGKNTAAVGNSSGSILTNADAWFYALFTVQRPGKLEPISLDELVKEARKATIRETSAQGEKIIILDLAYTHQQDDNARWKISIEFNAAKNYLINNIKYVSVGSVARDCMLHYDIPSFVEAAPGVYFPQKFVYEFSEKGKVTVKKTALFKNLQCNKPVGANDLALRYPHGITVRDAVKGAVYQVNESGAIISKETPIDLNSKPMEASGIKTKPTSSIPKKVISETSAESQGWPWIVYLLLGVVAVTIGYFVYIFLANRVSSSRD